MNKLTRLAIMTALLALPFFYTLGCITTEGAYASAKDFGLLEERLERKYDKYFDDKGLEIDESTARLKAEQGELVTVQEFEEYQVEAGATLDKAGEAIPYGTLAIGVITSILGVFGVGKFIKEGKKKVWNETPNES